MKAYTLKFLTAIACGNCQDRGKQAQLTTGTARESWFATLPHHPGSPCSLRKIGGAA
jgi:hypothetical protein